MDTFFEYAGAGAATALYDALSALGLPLLVACGGIAWRVYRVAEDGLVRPLAMYVLSLILLAWLIRPVAVVDEVRTPRLLAILGEGADLAVKRSTERLDKDFLTKPFEYERVAARAGQARVADPSLRQELAEFFACCTANAMAATYPAPVSERATKNPLAADSGLPYDKIRHSKSGEKCETVRGRLLEEVNRELDRNYVHRMVLDSVGEASREDYLGMLVRNEWHSRIEDGGEMFRVRQSVGGYDSVAAREAGKDASAPGDIPLRDASVSTFIGTVVQEFLSGWGKAGQATSDAMTSRQRYYLVTAHAPVLYGMILMLLTALFPVAGLWSLLPGRWTALVNYAKVFLSVKLWPIGWALISRFSAGRPMSQALREDAEAGDVFVASTLLYFLIPGLSFLVIQLGTAAAAIPFKEAVPAVAGPSNGPAGEVARMAVARIR